MAHTNIDKAQVKATDSVAKGTDKADEKAQADLKQQDPAQASEQIAKNTVRYVDGDGSGSKGADSVDAAQRALLDYGHTLKDDQAKELKPGELASKPEDAEVQVNKIGEKQQKALEAQKKAQEDVEEEARNEDSEQQKAEDERPNPNTKLDSEEKRVRKEGLSPDEAAKETK